MKTIFSHKLPNGKVETRTTEHEYKFVVVGKEPETGYHYKRFGTTWAVYSWHSTRELAEKKLASYRTWNNDNHPTDLRVEPVNGGK